MTQRWEEGRVNICASNINDAGAPAPIAFAGREIVESTRRAEAPYRIGICVQYVWYLLGNRRGGCQSR